MRLLGRWFHRGEPPKADAFVVSRFRDSGCGGAGVALSVIGLERCGRWSAGIWKLRCMQLGRVFGRGSGRTVSAG
eukprot:1468222-Alexandrium_andersonii.AAC.1